MLTPEIRALGPALDSPGSTLVIQVLLIAGILGITAWLFRTRGAKQLAVRRLLIIVFALFAVVTVAFPSITTRVANLVGVGRGTDLLLYATVVILLGFLALQEARTKNTEKRTTYLARRIALDDAEDPGSYRARSLELPGTQPPAREVAPEPLRGAQDSPGSA